MNTLLDDKTWGNVAYVIKLWISTTKSLRSLQRSLQQAIMGSSRYDLFPYWTSPYAETLELTLFEFACLYTLIEHAANTGPPMPNMSQFAKLYESLWRPRDGTAT